MFVVVVVGTSVIQPPYCGHPSEICVGENGYHEKATFRDASLRRREIAATQLVLCLPAELESC